MAYPHRQYRSRAVEGASADARGHAPGTPTGAGGDREISADVRSAVGVVGELSRLRHVLTANQLDRAHRAIWLADSSDRSAASGRLICPGSIELIVAYQQFVSGFLSCAAFARLDGTAGGC